MISNTQDAVFKTNLLFLVLTCLTTTLVLILSDLLQPLFLNPINPNLILKFWQTLLFPEPLERTLYLSLGALIPILGFFLTQQIYVSKISYSPYLSSFFSILIAILLFFPIYQSEYLKPLFVNSLMFDLSPNTFFFMSFLISILACLYTVRCKIISISPRWSYPLIWIIFIFLALLNISAWRLVTINSISTETRWWLHFDATIYSLSQVLQGKTLLVDLPSQYGLFPEFIAPILKLIGPNIKNIVLIFAILQIIALCSLFYVVSKTIKSPLLLLLSGITLLCLTSHNFVYFLGLNDPYFQYWPVRFFWPAVSVLFFHYFISKKTVFSQILVSATGAIGFLWVMDTGLFILLTFIVYLSAKYLSDLFKNKEQRLNLSKNYLFQLGLHFLTTALIVSLFFGWLWFKAGQPVQIEKIYHYQKIFYGLGFAMLPLPRTLHSWMSILAIYLLGTLIAFNAWRERKTNYRADLIFYLCFLGLGLFTYYQGRSHEFCLYLVTWPAFLIMVILCGSTLELIRQRNLSLTELCLPIIVLAFSLLCSLKFLVHIPKFVTDMKSNYYRSLQPSDPLITNELSFIKEHAGKNRECVIWSRRQAIYSIEANLGSPIKGPGLIEMLLQEDANNFYKNIAEGHFNCVFVGSKSYLEFMMPIDLSNNYQLVAINSLETMVFLKAKENR